jgi:hypothetical protein
LKFLQLLKLVSPSVDRFIYSIIPSIGIWWKLDGKYNGCIFSKPTVWDALIVMAAESAKCSEIWFEDLSDGQIIRGVKIVNPFK